MGKKYTFRLFPTEEQKEFFDKNFFCSRFIYEFFIGKIQYDEEVNKLEAGKGSLVEYEYNKFIPPMKREKEYTFLKEADSKALQGAMKKLFRDVYISRENHKSKYPLYKLPKNQTGSYLITQNIKESSMYITAYGLKVPKIESIQMNQTKYVSYNQKIKEVTIYKTLHDRYYATIIFFDNEEKEQ